MKMRYRILHELDGGGMGVVYEGRKLLPEGQELPVAIKMIRAGTYARGERKLFAREAMTSLRINHEHPNLVTTHDFGLADKGQPYMVMELVDGASVRQVAKAGKLPFPHARRIARDTLRALGHLHKRGVMHRDVTPANILMSREGTVKLADFGLVKPTDGSHSGNFRGTTAYASPEALQGRGMGEHSDIYSLGVVLYELLAGTRPHGSGEPSEVFTRMTYDPAQPLPEDTPADLVALVSGMMEFRAQDRAFAAAAEALAFLEEQGEPVADDAEIAALVEQACPRGKRRSMKPTRRLRRSNGDTLVVLRSGVYMEEEHTPRVTHRGVAPLAFVAGLAAAGLIFWLASAGPGGTKDAPAGSFAAECTPGEAPTGEIATTPGPGKVAVASGSDEADKGTESGEIASAHGPGEAGKGQSGEAAPSTVATPRKRSKPRTRHARAKPDQAPVSDKPLFYRVPPAEP